MIRNVVMGRLRRSAEGEVDPADSDQLDSAIAGILALDLVGQLAMQGGRDLGLRAGGWDFSITNVWADPDAYRAYDVEAEHNHWRALIVEVCSDLSRVQFEVAAP